MPIPAVESVELYVEDDTLLLVLKGGEMLAFVLDEFMRAVDGEAPGAGEAA